jgi:hypothetical protein
LVTQLEHAVHRRNEFAWLAVEGDLDLTEKLRPGAVESV